MTTARQIRRTLLTAGATATLAAFGIGGSVSASAATSSKASGSVLSKIRECESGGDYKAENPNSSASGAYQFLDSTWRGLDDSGKYKRAKNAPKSVQDKAARKLLAEQGTSPWNASKSCWG